MLAFNFIRAWQGRLNRAVFFNLRSLALPVYLCLDNLASRQPLTTVSVTQSELYSYTTR
jgi:hypothetical protein